MQAVVKLLQSAQKIKGKSVDSWWPLMRVLMPAAGVVKHLRHGFGKHPTASPRELDGDLAHAVAFISEVVARELHLTLDADLAFKSEHDKAEADAHHRWQHKFSPQEREMVVAEHALVANEKGLQWEVWALPRSNGPVPRLSRCLCCRSFLLPVLARPDYCRMVSPGRSSIRAAMRSTRARPDASSSKSSSTDDRCTTARRKLTTSSGSLPPSMRWVISGWRRHLWVVTRSWRT